MATLDDFKGYATSIAAQFGLNSNVFLAQIEQESSWNPNASSDGVHVGLGQFDSATAARFGLTDRTDPYASIVAMAQYDAQLLKSNNGDWTAALSQYGTLSGAAGPGTNTWNRFQQIIGGGGGIDAGNGMPYGGVDEYGRPYTGPSSPASGGSSGGMFSGAIDWIAQKGGDLVAIIIGLLLVLVGTYGMVRK